MTGLPYVEVRTRTRTTSGANAFTNWLAGAAFGGNSTSSAGACARAAVGTPASSTATLPLTFSACDWQTATGGTTGGGGGLVLRLPGLQRHEPVRVHRRRPAHVAGARCARPRLPARQRGHPPVAQNPPGGATPAGSCPTWQGHALPGGFGVLETNGGDPCSIKEYPFHWMKTDPGNNTSCDLQAYVGKVVNLPIYDCTNTSAPGSEPPIGNCDAGNGNNAYYHRVGYAQFYLSGYSMNVTGSIPNKVKSLVSNSFPCNGADRCISGWFLKGSLSATALSGPPTTGNFGTVGAVPAG